MKSRILLLAVVAGLAFTSCVSHQYRSRGMAAPETNITIKPMVAEIEVDLSKKITAKVTKVAILPNLKVGEAKAQAKWKALEESGADVLVDAVWHVTIGPFFIVSAEVTGFYGKYVYIKVAEDDQLEKLEMYNKYQSSSKGGGKTSILQKLKKLNPLSKGSAE